MSPYFFSMVVSVQAILLSGVLLLDAGMAPLEPGVVLSLLFSSTEEELSEDVVGAVLEASSPQLAQNMLVSTSAIFFQFL